MREADRMAPRNARRRSVCALFVCAYLSNALRLRRDGAEERRVAFTPAFGVRRRTATPSSRTQNFLRMESDGGGRRSNAHDTLVSALSADGGIVVRAVSARNLVQDALIRLQLSPVPAQALGEVAVCNLLLASGLKDREQLQLTIAGNGPISGITSIADGHGDVKAMLQGDRKFTGQQDASGSREKSIRRGIGRGQIQLVRSHPDWMQPFQSVTEIRCWMPSSMNQQSMLGWRSAGRWCRLLLGTMLRGCRTRQRRLCKEWKRDLKGLKNDSLSVLFRSGLTAPDLVDKILEGVGIMHGTYSTGAPPYKCSCSPERICFRAPSQSRSSSNRRSSR